MKRILLGITAGSLALLVFAPLASAFGWKDVVKMHRAGIADSLIIQKIEYSGETFDLDADEMETLADEGVSNSVISAMLRTEDERYDEEYDYDRYYYHPHRRVYLGWDYHYYPYYRPYYGGYYPYYGRYDYYGGYRYPRSAYRRHGTAGDYGTSRERTRVESRYHPRTQGGTTYRTPPPSRSYNSPQRSTPRSSGGSTTRTRR